MVRDPESGAAQEEAEPSARAVAEAFRIALPPLRAGEPPFEGPLDLILHLVREHEVDLFDIPIAKITESYLQTLEALRELDIDVAGEFLHMAAQLVLMKSKLLLPRTEVAEDAPAAEDTGVDPRAELVRRLLEYQKYKAAGEELGSRDILDHAVFVRRARAERAAAPEGPDGLADVSVFKLIEALDRALAAASPKLAHEVYTDRLTISDAIARVADVLRVQRRARFEELLAGPDARNDRSAVISTFLAILEMAKLKLIRIYQSGLDEAGPGAEILVEARDSLGEGAPTVQEE
ncbi:MAG TPA: segregation/condensation protein A [Anaeromyxobacter sp.]